MRTILYVIAVLLVVGWIIGLALKVAGGLIHLLLVVAVVAVLISMFQSRKP